MPDDSRLPIYRLQQATIPQFIQYWGARYRDENEHLYTASIRGPQTRETLTKLLRWKLGVFSHAGRISASLEQNFLSRIDTARKLSKGVSAEEFLQQFPSGGAILRIFWLHCWHPRRFPIYDQHVYRAMRFIREGKKEELRASRVIDSYLQSYLPFFEPFRAAAAELPFDVANDGLPERMADRALVMFGLEIKSGFLEV